MHIKRLQHVYHQRYTTILRRLKNKKEPLTVLFLAIDASVWKYDSLYQQMTNDPLFTPIILICPQVNRGVDFMIKTMRKCASHFETKGYPYITAYDENTSEYFDANSLSPDIVFYTNPYKGLIHDKYYIDKFTDSLTCYVNYAYNNVQKDYAYNLSFHHYLWRYYQECDLNFQLVEKHSPIKAINCRVVGYPMYDAFVGGANTSSSWKLNDSQHKRIIWSPHHTIDGRDEIIKFSTFLLYHDCMVSIAERFNENIEIVFKPHPLLKINLYEHPDWGKERTDKYYDYWKNGVNTSLVEGEYIDLFNSSDAIINDSGSFTIEYLYTKKPCLFLSNYNRKNDANDVTLKAFDCWYHATNVEEIEKFISDVVIDNMDSLKSLREQFYNEVLLPPNGCSVAENIINEIKKELHKCNTQQ